MLQCVYQCRCRYHRWCLARDTVQCVAVFITCCSVYYVLCCSEFLSAGSAIVVVVASISSLLKIIGLFCKRALLKRRYSAKETCNLNSAKDFAIIVVASNTTLFSVLQCL